MKTKVCSQCHKEKPVSEYYPRRERGEGVVYPACKECHKRINNEAKERKAKWHQENKERLSAQFNEWKKNNRDVYLEQKRNQNQKAWETKKDEMNAYQKAWREAHKESRKKTTRGYYDRNKSKICEYACGYMKARRKSDPEYMLRINLRAGVRYALRKGEIKSGRTLSLIGCSVAYLKKHIESKFKDGMSWDNYGVNGWHIDHIYPCAAFDLTKESEQKLCFNYTNLQPMWADENRSKQDNIVSPKPDLVLEFDTQRQRRKTYKAAGYRVIGGVI